MVSVLLFACTVFCALAIAASVLAVTRTVPARMLKKVDAFAGDAEESLQESRRLTATVKALQVEWKAVQFELGEFMINVEKKRRSTEAAASKLLRKQNDETAESEETNGFDPGTPSPASWAMQARKHGLM